MIQEVAGGVVSSEIIDIYPKRISNPIVKLRYKKLKDVIGDTISKESVKSILNDLGIEIISSDKDSLQLKIPLYRVDVTREIDVIEEILRIYGFNSIKMTNSMILPFISNESYNSTDLTNVISNLLISNGFFEIINNSIDNSKNINLVKEFDENQNVEIINSLTHDLNVMRQTMLFGGLKSISYNLNRKNSVLKMFEFGKIYKTNNSKFSESQRLSIFMCGNISSENWRVPNNGVDFYYLKQRVSMILQKLGLLKYEASELSSFGIINGLEYKIKNESIVSFGKIDAKITKNFNIKKEVYYADFNWDVILKHKINIMYQPVSKFPSVKRDLSMLVDKSITFDRLELIAKKSVKGTLLSSVSLFDVYEGDKIPNDKKSYAISFIFSDSSKTLTDNIIEKMMNKITSSYNDIGAIIRKD